MQPQNDPWQAVPPTNQQPAQPTLKLTGKLRRNVMRIVVIVLLIGGLVVVWLAASAGLKSYERRQATAAAVNYIRLLNTGKDNQAYQSSSSALRAAQSEDQFAANLGDLTAKHPVFKRQSIKLEGSKATYMATVDGLPATYSGRTDGIFTIGLVKHGLTTWQVDTLDVK